MAYLMYVSAALTHLWAIYAPQNQYWIMKGCRMTESVFFCASVYSAAASSRTIASALGYAGSPLRARIRSHRASPPPVGRMIG